MRNTLILSATAIILGWFALMAYISHNDTSEKDAFMEDCLNHFQPQYKCMAMWKNK